MHLINAALGNDVDDPGYRYRFIADEFAGLGFTAQLTRITSGGLGA